MRKLVFAIIVIIGSLMIASAIVPYLIPTETYRSWVEEKVAGNLNARVAIDRFHFQMIPYPGYTIRGFRLVSTEAPFKGQGVITAKKIIGSLSFLNLARGRIVTSIKARDVVVDVRQAEGKNNIAMLFPAGDSIGLNDGEISIRSAELLRGRINVTGDTMQRPFVIDGVEAIVENIHSMQEDHGQRISSMDARASGRMIGSEVPNVMVGARVFHDSSRGIVEMRDGGAWISGSQVAFDAMLNTGMKPASFKVHLASPALDYGSIAEVMLALGDELPMGLAWQGSVAIDISAEGTRDSFDLEMNADATDAQLSVGRIVSKGAGLPLKLSTSLLKGGELISIGEGRLTFSDDELTFAGDIASSEPRNVNLKVEGKDLDTAIFKFLIPRVAIFERVSGLELGAKVEGELADDKMLQVKGNFSSREAVLAGTQVADLQGTFARSEVGISFPIVNGLFAGGKLSGNGEVILGDSTDYKFKAVVDRLEAEKVECLDGILSGTARMSFEAATSGIDPITVAGALAVSGTFMMDEGELVDIEPGSDIFTTDTMSEVEKFTGEKVDSKLIAELKKSDEEIEELDSSFEYSGGDLSAIDARWKTSGYGIKLEAALDRFGGMEGSGVVALKSEIAIPISVTGELVAPEFTVDATKLERLREEKVASEKHPGEPAKIIRAPKKEEVAKKPPPKTEPKVKAKPKPAPKSKPKPKKKRSRPARRRPKKSYETPLQDPQDILKVIIGN